MTVTVSETKTADLGDTTFYLEALHWHGYTVTIHSPKTSRNGLYSVSAYQHAGKRLVALRGHKSRLHDAIVAAAVRLGEDRLMEYALHAMTEKRPERDR
jgi:hypothetical protein